MYKKIFLSSLSLCVLIISSLNAQVTTPTNIAAPPPQYVGWDASPGSTSKNLDVKNYFFNRNINFFTNGTGVNGSSVQRMTIIGSAGPTAGFVGIGLTAPAYQLDVQDNININIPSGFLNGYRINGFTVLQTPGVENTFVGRGSGANYNLQSECGKYVHRF